MALMRLHAENHPATHFGVPASTPKLFYVLFLVTRQPEYHHYLSLLTPHGLGIQHGYEVIYGRRGTYARIYQKI
jgi:hypothetical protein